MLLLDDVHNFIDYLRTEKQLSEHTIKSYNHSLQSFNSFLNQQSVKMWSQVTHHLIRRYVAELHRSELSAKSIAQKISAIRSFYNFLFKKGEVSSNPAKGVVTPKFDKRLPKTLDVDEVSVLLNKIPDTHFINARDKAMLELFYSSGVRLSELQQLEIDDIDLFQATMRVVGKGNKTRIVPVGNYALLALEHWLKIRQSFCDLNQKSVFITQTGKSLKRRSIQARLEIWGKRTGLSSPLHPHKLRHSCASHFLESASDLRAVQELLGHANLATTQIYTHLDFQHLAKVFDAAHPRARKKTNHD